MKPETRLKIKFAAELKIIPNSYFIKTNEVAKRGVLDFIGCVNSFFVVLELKKDDNEEPDDLQKYSMMRAYNAGGYHFVVTPSNWKKVIQKLRSFNTQHR